MELGVFCPIVNNHNVVSTNLKPFEPTWELNQRFVQMAEDAGMKFALSQVTLAGWGGKTEQWDRSLESFTLMAALGAVTSRIRLYGSVAVLTIPPPIVARMAVTINEISDGRFGVNIVSGYNKKQYDQMGLWPGEEFFSTRYDYAEEYVQILKELWSTGESNFRGKFFEMRNCKLGPLPKEPIEIVCAGASGRGLDFTAKFGDYSFLMPANGAEGVRQANSDLLEAARRYGRNVGSYILQMVIIGDTDEEAQAKVEYYKEGADIEALGNMLGDALADAGGTTSQRIGMLRESTFYGLNLIVGSPETVAREIQKIGDVEGTAGVMLTFDEPIATLERFVEEVMPRLQLAPTAA
jgi:pyrimidine oxygenase